MRCGLCADCYANSTHSCACAPRWTFAMACDRTVLSSQQQERVTKSALQLCLVAAGHARQRQCAARYLHASTCINLIDGTPQNTQRTRARAVTSRRKSPKIDSRCINRFHARTADFDLCTTYGIQRGPKKLHQIFITITLSTLSQFSYFWRIYITRICNYTVSQKKTRKL